MNSIVVMFSITDIVTRAEVLASLLLVSTDPGWIVESVKCI